MAGAAVAALIVTLTARAQGSMRRISVLMPGHEGDPEYQARVEVFTRALQEAGWTPSRDVDLEVRWVPGGSEAANEAASEFSSLPPDVVVSSGSVLTAALKGATSSIPVVFVMVNEPVLQGFVPNLSRPGGNMTGFTNIDFATVGKSVALLKTMVSSLKRVGLMYNSERYPIYDRYLDSLQNEKQRPVDVVRSAVHAAPDIDSAIRTLAAAPGSGVAVLADGGFTIANRAAIQAALDRYRLPSIAPFRQFVSEGALMSYGPDDLDIYRRAAGYVDRILKGANPAELPVQRPVKFDLVINRKTAKSLGYDIPPTLAALADDIIE